MTVLVSVVVPIHDGERYLSEALESIAGQDYAEIETIVIDDGSTDGGPELARRHGAVVHSQDRRGVAAARNVGVALARGEIIAFLDQDDLWLSAKVRRQVDALTRAPERISLVQQTYFLEPGAHPPPWFGKPELLVTEHNGWVPSCLALRRATFERVGRFDERLRHGSDLDWFVRATQMDAEIEVIPEALVRRRLHAGNDSATPAAMTEMFAVLRMAAARKRRGTP